MVICLVHPRCRLLAMGQWANLVKKCLSAKHSLMLTTNSAKNSLLLAKGCSLTGNHSKSETNQCGIGIQRSYPQKSEEHSCTAHAPEMLSMDEACSVPCRIRVTNVCTAPVDVPLMDWLVMSMGSKEPGTETVLVSPWQTGPSLQVPSSWPKTQNCLLMQWGSVSKHSLGRNLSAFGSRALPLHIIMSCHSIPICY